MIKPITAFFVVFFLVSSARADVTWLPTESTYNGTPFADVGGFPGVGMTTTGMTAYGAGGNASGVYVMGFANTVISALPTFGQSELSSTVLSAGTALVLEFSKAAQDDVNFVALLADTTQTVSFELVNPTRIRIRCTIADPVQSASGDAGAAFGLVINYASSGALDFGGTTFVTDMHYLDISAPSDLNPGTAGLNANGVNGVAARVRAYLPLHFLNTFGITSANTSEVQGYLDGTPVSGASFTNLGSDSSLGFEFGESANPSNTVLKVEVSNSAWSPHTVGFGRLDEAAPTFAITGSTRRNVTSATATVRGTVSDISGVGSVQFSKRSKRSGFRGVSVRDGRWSARVSALPRRKTIAVFFKAVDVLGNATPVKTIKITRR